MRKIVAPHCVDEVGKSEDIITVARVEVEDVGVGCCGGQQVREPA